MTEKDLEERYSDLKAALSKEQWDAFVKEHLRLQQELDESFAVMKKGMRILQ